VGVLALCVSVGAFLQQSALRSLKLCTELLHLCMGVVTDTEWGCER
jgi:hypothetical protein